MFIILFKAKRKIVSGQEFIMSGFAKSTLYCSLTLRCQAKNNHLVVNVFNLTGKVVIC